MNTKMMQTVMEEALVFLSVIGNQKENINIQYLLLRKQFPKSKQTSKYSKSYISSLRSSVS